VEDLFGFGLELGEGALDGGALAGLDIESIKNAFVAITFLVPVVDQAVIGEATEAH